MSTRRVHAELKACSSAHEGTGDAMVIVVDAALLVIIVVAEAGIETSRCGKGGKGCGGRNLLKKLSFLQTLGSTWNRSVG